MSDQVNNKTQDQTSEVSRRGFLKTTGTVAAGVGVSGALSNFILISEAVAAIKVSGGYLLVDTLKCAGCMSCMLSCSLVHEGKENLSLSRIQILSNPFGKFPHDINLAFCRQCVEPECVKACPTGACHVDAKNGNVRRIDAAKCISCEKCVEACPFTPSRATYNYEARNAQKCDLCTDTPHWNEKGGVNGKRACEEMCPMRAIKFTTKTPIQKGSKGYEANLRTDNWRTLGFQEPYDSLP